MRYIVTMVAVLSLFWLLNSGHYNGLILGMGVFSVLLVTWIANRMQGPVHESIPTSLFLRLPRYLGWLSLQVVASNLDIVRRVWRREVDIDPLVVRVPLPQSSDIVRVTYAASINLTPGTLTIDIGDDYLVVHALDHDITDALEAGEMSARVSELER